MLVVPFEVRLPDLRSCCKRGIFLGGGGVLKSANKKGGLEMVFTKHGCKRLMESAISLRECHCSTSRPLLQ